ncbi:hypothetical protein HZH68_015532 [Vespula germanica]|uniref:Uncharacterized protein n=1 Tax=Vespula germanica TaxID=30212 RepID=A0A834J6H7_VESGE|nr:hypothetical protein HZH68_015532 [Vespula germanica]
MDVTDDHYDSVAAENEEGKFDVEDKEEKKNDDDDSPTVEETYEVTTTKPTEQIAISAIKFRSNLTKLMLSKSDVFQQ